MARVFPVDEFVSEEWYPGFKPSYGHAPWVVEPLDTFSKDDEDRMWFLDFHWPRGLTPMGFVWNEDGYTWATQLAAESMPLPTGRGFAGRVAGSHLYGSAIPVENEHEVQTRSKRLSRNLPAFLNDFNDIWARCVEEVNDTWSRFHAADLASMSRAQLGDYLRQARRFHRRAFEIHFQVMYPLLANYVGFYGICTELGIDPGEIGKFLQGYDTKIMETDRELWRLTRQARQAGLESVFASTPPEKLSAALKRDGGAAAQWLSKFDAFLDTYGWRTEGSCDVALPSWVEDPTPALGTIKSFLAKGEEHDFEAAHEQAVEERTAAIDAARSRLTAQEQESFDAGLATCEAANFPWWQDDHNYYIDLRISLPMRWACLEIAEKVGAQRPDDTLFLFWPEMMGVVDGEQSYDRFRSIIEDRRQYFDYWYERRASMPKVLGTVPESVDDPILIEIYGLNAHYLTAVQNIDSDVRTLTGVPGSKGKARGIARVLSDSDELHRIQPGEVLVCESTSPNWTPAFAKIAACVCDGGGMLSHAAMVGREYGVPTVTAAGFATVAIDDGDEVEVDGTTGRVTIFAKQPGTASA